MVDLTVAPGPNPSGVDRPSRPRRGGADHFVPGRRRPEAEGGPAEGAGRDVGVPLRLPEVPRGLTFAPQPCAGRPR